MSCLVQSSYITNSTRSIRVRNKGPKEPKIQRTQKDIRKLAA